VREQVTQRLLQGRGHLRSVSGEHAEPASGRSGNPFLGKIIPCDRATMACVSAGHCSSSTAAGARNAALLPHAGGGVASDALLQEV
jgi:hypothetical protein